MSTSSFTMQIFNHDNSYIVMERGKFLSTMPIFLWQLFMSCLQVPLLWRLFNHDNSYIVMERGKFLITMPMTIILSTSSFIADFFVMSTSSFTMLCRLLTMTIPILSWNVASSSVLCQFFFFLTTSSFCHDNSYIDYKFQFFLLCRLLETFNHDNSYIVMERGKFLFWH